MLTDHEALAALAQEVTTAAETINVSLGAHGLAAEPPAGAFGSMSASSTCEELWSWIVLQADHATRNMRLALAVDVAKLNECTSAYQENDLASAEELCETIFDYE